jgi:predicted transcriptional regulator
MSTRPTSFTAIIENLEKIDAIAARTKRSRSYVINEAMEKLIEQDQEQKEPPTKKKAGAR